MNRHDLLKPRGRTLALWVLSCALFIPPAFSSFVTSVQNRLLDAFYSFRGDLPSPPELLLVGIDEASFQEIGLPWPWPRSLHALLVKRLSQAGARLIVFDILFADPSDPVNDAELAAAIKEAGSVLLAETYDRTDDRRFNRIIKVRPINTLAEAAKGTALAMIKPDDDGVVRHFQFMLEGEYTLASAAASYAKSVDFPPETSGLIRYIGPPRSIDTLSYYQIIDEDFPPPVERIRDRIVLIGRILTASASPGGQADFFPTPFYSGAGGTSGIEIHANIIHNLLTGRWVKELPFSVLLLTYCVFFFFLALLFVHVSPLAGLGTLIVASTALVGTSYSLFVIRDVWVPPVLYFGGAGFLYTGNVLIQYIQESKKKKKFRSALSRYVSSAVAKEISENPEALELGGKEVQATVFFSDLAGFTNFSERLHPKTLVGFLNEYFTPMTQIILEHQGGLDKFIGDAIMAFWGVLLPLENHAQLACQSALKMQEVLVTLHEGWRSRNLPILRARMGLHSGMVVAGNIGSADRINYTLIGDAVNLASRLETVNKIYGTGIIISEDTLRLAGPGLLVRELDWIRVKGRQEHVTIYELLDPGMKKDLKFLDIFAEGLAEYRSRSWNQAERYFHAIAAHDPPSRMYAGRCRLYAENPPPEDWDGVFVQKTK
jgi:adenylate cyclase